MKSLLAFWMGWSLAFAALAKSEGLAIIAVAAFGLGFWAWIKADREETETED